MEEWKSSGKNLNHTATGAGKGSKRKKICKTLLGVYNKRKEKRELYMGKQEHRELKNSINLNVYENEKFYIFIIYRGLYFMPKSF
jgi:hypothetical protein